MTTTRILPAVFGAALFLAATGHAQIGFQGAQTFGVAANRPSWVTVGDFDGSGSLDLAVTTGSPQGVNGPDWVELFQGQGNGGFVPGQIVFLGNNVGSSAVVAEDFDGDGDTDLAVCLKNTNAVQILVNTGGVFALGSLVSVNGSEPRHMAVGDVDEDGDLDIVTSNRASNSLSVLLNDGAGGFAFGGSIAVGAEPRYVVLENFDGDCTLDIAVAAHDSRRIDVLFGDGAGGFGGLTSIPVPGNEKPSGLTAADFDGDGDMDLATGTDNNGIGLICTFTNQGGSFFGTCITTGGSNPGAVIAADLDGDGDMDLATADEDSNFVTALANMGGTFALAGSFGVGAHPSHLACGDFDGDGSMDLATANRDSNSVSVLMNTGAGGAGTFCVTSANSIGAGARIGSTGTLSIAQNTFTLTVKCAPTPQTGLFFYGASATNVAFGEGRLCISGTVVRLNPPLVIDGSGGASRLLDFTAEPIPPGVTRNFQFWYRDPAGGGSNFNLSDGLSATFRP